MDWDGNMLFWHNALCHCPLLLEWGSHLRQPNIPASLAVLKLVIPSDIYAIEPIKLTDLMNKFEIFHSKSQVNEIFVLNQ